MGRPHTRPTTRAQCPPFQSSISKALNLHMQRRVLLSYSPRHILGTELDLGNRNSRMVLSLHQYPYWNTTSPYVIAGYMPPGQRDSLFYERYTVFQIYMKLPIIGALFSLSSNTYLGIPTVEVCYKVSSLPAYEAYSSDILT